MGNLKEDPHQRQEKEQRDKADPRIEEESCLEKGEARDLNKQTAHN